MPTAPAARHPLSQRNRMWVHTATAITTIAVCMGAVVCATESSAACPTWPGCYPGQFAPNFEINPLIEFIHRVVSMATAPALLVAGLLTRPHPDRRVRVLPWVALIGALAAGVFGMFTILTGLPVWAGVLDLLCALTAMVVMVLTSVLLVRGEAEPAVTLPVWAPISLFAMIGALHALGIIVAGPSSFTRCISWPLWFVLDTDNYPALQLLRVVLAVTITVAVAGVAVKARSAISASGLVIIVGAAVGLLAVLIHLQGFTQVLGATYGVASVLLLASVAVLLGQCLPQHSQHVPADEAELAAV